MKAPLYTSIDEMELPVRVYHALKNSGVETIGEILKMSEAALLRIPNIGRSSLLDLKIALARMGHNPLATKERRVSDPQPDFRDLRDEIALRVMTTLLSVDARSFFEQVVQGNGPAAFRNIATISYAMADAMMKERG